MVQVATSARLDSKLEGTIEEDTKLNNCSEDELSKLMDGVDEEGVGYNQREEGY